MELFVGGGGMSMSSLLVPLSLELSESLLLFDENGCEGSSSLELQLLVCLVSSIFSL